MQVITASEAKVRLRGFGVPAAFGLEQDSRLDLACVVVGAWWSLNEGGRRCLLANIFGWLTVFNLAFPLAFRFRGVAQLVEHWFPKPAVAGSSPSAPVVEMDRVFRDSSWLN